MIRQRKVLLRYHGGRGVSRCLTAVHALSFILALADLVLKLLKRLLLNADIFIRLLILFDKVPHKDNAGCVLSVISYTTVFNTN
jgi:hypothetical protein